MTAVYRWICLVLAFGLVSCEKETIVEPDPVPEFAVSPSSLSISDTLPQGTFYVASDAPASISWRVTATPAWVTVNPESGVVSQTPIPVVVQADASGLSPGVYRDKIYLLSSGGAAEVSLTFLVDVHPLAEVAPTELLFDESADQLPLRLRNKGTGPLQWNATGQPAWLSVIPDDGWVTAGDSVALTVHADRSGLPPGTETGSVTIESNSDGGTITVPVTLAVPAAPRLSVEPDSVRFDYFVDAAAFTVANTGNAPLSWQASASESYVGLDPASGLLAPGGEATVAATVNRTGLASGSWISSIRVESDEGQSDTVGVRVRHFEEVKWLLDRQIVDAEFSRATNRIVAVSDGPAALHLLDPESRAMQTLSLPLTPACVAIRQDGAYAAVGHNGFVTYVDLTAMTIVRTYSLTADALDIILPANGWVYVFPRRDQWTTIRCIRLSTGEETAQTGRSIYAGMLGRLHPSGSYIYGADNNLSPSDFYKFDVQPGTAAFLWDSPYHGDYLTGGNLWFSDDGARIFGWSGDVFRSSTTQSLDLTYNGHLSGFAYGRWVEHSTAAGRVFAVPGDSWSSEAPPEIRVYGSEFLAFLGTIPLPGFLVPNGSGGGTLYHSKGQYAFCNEAGTHLYTLVRAASGSGLVHDWALVVSNITATP